MGDILEPGVIIRPGIDAKEAEKLLNRLYGLKSRSVKEFNSYDDRNFFFKVDEDTSNAHLQGKVWPAGYILKVTNRIDSADPSFSDAQNEMILHMSAAGLEVPEPVQNISGHLRSLETLETADKSTKNMVRLLKFIPGKTLYEIGAWNSDHFLQAGEFVARMDLSLTNFSHPTYNTRNSIWFLSSIPSVRDFTHAVSDPSRKDLVLDVINTFCRTVVPVCEKLEQGIIHGDFNEQNILCREKQGGEDGEYEIYSVIDFGDSQHNPLVFELGITIMYMMTQCRCMSPLLAGGHVVAGYIRQRQLAPLERKVLRTCVAARFAQSLVMGAYSYSQDPGNEYLLITAATGWETLANFWTTPEHELYAQWDKIISSHHPGSDHYMSSSLENA